MRILLIGDSTAAGFGVRTHHLGVAGQLARQLAVLSYRGIEIQTHVDPSLTARLVPGVIDASIKTRYDVIIVMLATNDAMALTALWSWKRSMKSSIASLKSATPNGFITMVADIRVIGRLAFLTRLICGKHAQVLNRTIETMSTANGLPLIRLDSAPSLNSATYEIWARAIADSVMSAIIPSPRVWPPRSRQQWRPHDPNNLGNRR